MSNETSQMATEVDPNSLLLATLTFIEDTTTWYLDERCAALSRRFSLPGSVEAEKTASVIEVNLCLRALGGIPHFYNEGQSEVPVLFTQWKGPDTYPNHGEPDYEALGAEVDLTVHDWVIAVRQANSVVAVDISIDTLSLIDELRAAPPYIQIHHTT